VTYFFSETRYFTFAYSLELILLLEETQLSLTSLSPDTLMQYAMVGLIMPLPHVTMLDFAHSRCQHY